MKKLTFTVVLFVLVMMLAACGNDDALKIGASPTPHAVILEEVKPILKEKGIDLEIIEIQDFAIPNKSLAGGDIDANYFQHDPYLKDEMEKHGYDLVNIGGVHIEPIGVYSKEYSSLENLPEGASIIMSSSITDHGRILSMLEEKGLITLAEGVAKQSATLDDIADNPKGFKFRADIDPGLLTRAYEEGEGDAVLINSNFALDAGLDPAKDPIALESAKDNPYENIVAVRNGDENREDIKALLEALQSDEIKSFIEEKYKGAIISVE